MNIDSKKYKMYIDGEFIDSSSGETFDNINPLTGKVINSVPKATAEDVERALDAARTAQKNWKKVPSNERGDYLFKIADAILEHADEFAQIISEEVGKVLAQAKRRS
ncbi:Aldehyde dehydrogenase family protein [Pisciglobus halotolerans]|uniref:Aldehyde dehydrogenase family protein n=1 Tax=Pisciglobus halotolerans TaxID=745365 RepID=A0A1I3B3V5_9LACT|nr:Aldehyde dehydrogenase family protein [Pisciglobus halotolerans]